MLNAYFPEVAAVLKVLPLLRHRTKWSALTRTRQSSTASKVNTGAVSEYDVPHDGRIKVEIPAYRPSCGVYLFDAIKIRGNGDPLKSWMVSVRRNGKTVRKQSLRATQKSPMDGPGYHIVRIAQ